MSASNRVDAQKQFIAECPQVATNTNAPPVAWLQRLRTLFNKNLIGPGDHVYIESDDGQSSATILIPYANQNSDHWNDLLNICDVGTEVVVNMRIGNKQALWIGRLDRESSGNGICLKFSSRFASVADRFNKFRDSNKHGDLEFHAFNDKGAAPVISRDQLANGNFKWIVRISVVAGECISVASTRAVAQDGALAQLQQRNDDLVRQVEDLKNQRTTFQTQFNDLQNQIRGNMQQNHQEIRNMINNHNNNGGGNNYNNNNNNGGGNNNNNNNNGGGNGNNNNNFNNNNNMVATLGNNILSPSAAIAVATNPFAAAQTNPMVYARNNVELCNKVAGDLNVNGVSLQLAHTWGPVVMANDPSYIERRLSICAGDLANQYSQPKLRSTLLLRATKTIKQIMEPLSAICAAFANNQCNDDEVKSTLNEIQQHVIFFFGNFKGYSETTIEEAINKFQFTGTAAPDNVFKSFTPDFNNNNNNRNNKKGGGSRPKSSGRGGGRGRGRGGRGGGNNYGGHGSGNQAAGGSE